MKNKIIIFLFVASTLLGQLIEPLSVEVTQQSQINYQIYQLQKEIDKQFNEDIKNGLEPIIIKIDKENIIIKDNKAIVNIDVYSNTSNKKRVLKNQEILFTKNNSLSFEKFPEILGQTLKRSKELKQNNALVGKDKSSSQNRTTTVGTIDIKLSDNVFIPYPIFEHTNDGDIYEIDFGLTEDTYGIQLFSAGAAVDGCVYYESYTDEDTYVRIAFYVDPDWKRIMYAREEDGEPGAICGFWGDVNVRLKKPVAIDVNEDGEIFVLDAEVKAVYKLQYNSSTNTIISSYNSKIIDGTYLNNPSDLSYSNCLSYNYLTDDFIAISDMGKNSIMMFNKDGSFMTEYSQYDGNQISKPKRIVAFSNSNGHRLLAFIDDNKVVSANANYYSNLTDVSISSLFPTTSYLSDIGISANAGGFVDHLIVSDKRQNMLHYFDETVNYICSYQGSEEYYFIAPLRVYSTSFASWGFSNSLRLDFYSMDMWSRVRGIKKFVPGADILNINVTRGLFKWILSFDETNIQMTNYELKDVVTNQLVSTGSKYAFDSELIPGRQYMWTVSFTPYHNNLYGDYEVEPKSKSIFFINDLTVPSTISSNATISSGSYSILSNTTIEEGVTLTIAAGTNITFQNGSALIVNGTLNVNGNSSNKVLFDFQYPQNVPAN
ncbi:MAG: hypothetical protein COW71_05950, partial [Ignavibacteriales bacterium CG18_big_fil_WC_8_21_14_2_50_31_20]